MTKDQGPSTSSGEIPPPDALGMVFVFEIEQAGSSPAKEEEGKGREASPSLAKVLIIIRGRDTRSLL